jgi:hypothetical protein
VRYFPGRARRKANIGAKLNVCTYCLGDLFADGRCVQCHAVIAFDSAPLPVPLPVMIAPIARREPLLN